MTTIRQPEITLSLASAAQAQENTAQLVCIVGQKTAAGTHAGAGALETSISNDASEWEGLFGKNSQLAAMIRAFKEIAPMVRLDAIVLDDNGATKRVFDIDVGANATAAGTLVFVIGSDKRHRYTVPVADNEAGLVTITAAEALINADTTCPFTANANVLSLELTAVNAGTLANDLGIELLGNDGVVSITTFAEQTAGASDPSLTGVYDVLGTDVRYHQIVHPYPEDLTVLLAFLDPRFNATNNVLDGMAVTCDVGDFATMEALATAEDTQSLIMITDKTEAVTNKYSGPAQNEPSYQKAASLAALRAVRLTQDASISQFLTSSASLDQFGGPATASLPYFNSVIPSLPNITSGRGWMDSEIELLHDAGATVLGTNSANTTGLVGEVPTTYKTDGANADITWKYANYVDTASQAREYMANNLRARFGQSRLTEGNVARGRDMANTTVINAYLDQLYQDLAGPSYVLVQDGETAIQYFKANRTTVLDLATGKATVTMLLPIVTQLRIIIATVKISFSTEG